LLLGVRVLKKLYGSDAPLRATGCTLTSRENLDSLGVKVQRLDLNSTAKMYTTLGFQERLIDRLQDELLIFG
jgi:hypothetical protein